MTSSVKNMGDLVDLTAVVGASDFFMSPGIGDAHLNLGCKGSFGATLTSCDGGTICLGLR
eukprot:5241548-Ditylum_brightwellii.AAC.1